MCAWTYTSFTTTYLRLEIKYTFGYFNIKFVNKIKQNVIFAYKRNLHKAKWTSQFA